MQAVNLEPFSTSCRVAFSGWRRKSSLGSQLDDGVTFGRSVAR